MGETIIILFILFLVRYLIERSAEQQALAEKKAREQALIAEYRKKDKELAERRQREAERLKREQEFALEKQREAEEINRLRQKQREAERLKREQELAEQARLEELKYETTLIVDAYVDLANKPQAVVRKNDNTYCYLERQAHTEPFEINAPLRLLKTHMQDWNWLDETTYRNASWWHDNKIHAKQVQVQEAEKAEQLRVLQAKQEAERAEQQRILQAKQEAERAEQLRREQLAAEARRQAAAEKERAIKTKSRKSNWSDYSSVLVKNNITKLYHFTDSSNIASIKKNGGLFSWHYCEQNGLYIPKAGGGDLSRNLDMRYGLEDYVRLSFTRNHPMMYVAQKDGRINNPVVLEISIEACFWEGTKFSNMNATRNGHSCGTSVHNLEGIHFQTVKQANHFDLSEYEKPYYQAEVLVKTCLPIEFITNI